MSLPGGRAEGGRGPSSVGAAPRPAPEGNAARSRAVVLPSERQLVRLADKLSRSRRDRIRLDFAAAVRFLAYERRVPVTGKLVGRFPGWVTEGSGGLLLEPPRRLARQRHRS